MNSAPIAPRLFEELSREVAIGRIRDALAKAGLGTVAVKDGWEERRG